MPSPGFSPLALQDIHQSVRWFQENASQNLVERYFEAVQATVLELVQRPQIGSPCNFEKTELAGIRRWPVKDFNRWLIFYFPVKPRIQVVRVLHGARDLDAILDSHNEDPAV